MEEVDLPQLRSGLIDAGHKRLNEIHAQRLEAEKALAMRLDAFAKRRTLWGAY